MMTLAATTETVPHPIMVAKGLGGRVELNGEFIRIVRGGFINHILAFLGGGVPRVSTVVPLERVASLGIVEPLILNNFLVIAYPGSPPMTGRLFRDALAENALLLNFFDNRGVYRLVREAERMIYRRDIRIYQDGPRGEDDGSRPDAGDGTIPVRA